MVESRRELVRQVLQEFPDGVAMTVLYRRLGNHIRKEEMHELLDELYELRIIKIVRERTRGRPRMNIYYLGS